MDFPASITSLSELAFASAEGVIVAKGGVTGGLILTPRIADRSAATTSLTQTGNHLLCGRDDGYRPRVRPGREPDHDARTSKLDDKISFPVATATHEKGRAFYCRSGAKA